MPTKTKQIPDARRIWCDLTPEQHKQLRVRAALEDRTMVAVVRDAILRYLEQDAAA